MRVHLAVSTYAARCGEALCGETRERAIEGKRDFFLCSNSINTSCATCLKISRVRTHFAPMTGARTTCGIQPSRHRPTKTRDNWGLVTCKACIDACKDAREAAREQALTAAVTSRPTIEIKIDTERRRLLGPFYRKFGFAATRKLLLKHTNNRTGRLTRLSDSEWYEVISEAQRDVPPTSRPAEWGDLYFWPRNRPNNSWYWLQAREISLFKWYGTETGRWSSPYSGKLRENQVQSHPTVKFVWDDLKSNVPKTVTEVNMQRERADILMKTDFRELEARVHAAMASALLYGSGSYKLENPVQPNPVKESSIMSNSLNTNFESYFGYHPSAHVPAQHGQPWTYDSDQRLVRFLKGGFTVAEIANELGRSDVAIECRITFLAFADERAAVLTAGIAKLTAEPKAPRAKRKAKKSRK